MSDNQTPLPVIPVFDKGDIVRARHLTNHPGGIVQGPSQNGTYLVEWIATRHLGPIPANESYVKIGSTSERANEVRQRRAITRTKGRKW